jgi:4-hydroxy-tetrahydrodipicolinate reductase
MPIGRDAGVYGDPVVVAITDWSASLCDTEAVIDLTAPAVSVDIAEKAADAGLVHVVGTTGFTDEQEARIAAASRNAVIIKSDNMSLGANLLGALVGRAATVLRDFDVQIIEMHHRQKKDAPSGTALMLGRAAAVSRSNYVSDAVDSASAVGFASLRGGTVVGEHKVIFAGAHERVIFEHIAEDRSVFARGAIAAAKWARGRTPGLYSMSDVLGL